MRRALGLLAAVLVAWPSAAAAQSARLFASLTPERLGQGTTIGFGFQITAPAHQVPPPLTAIELSYPVELGFALSELGIAMCSTEILWMDGPEGCPPDSLMGRGAARSEVRVGPQILQEKEYVTILRTTEQDDHLALLIFVEGVTPVSAEVIFPGLVFPARRPFGGQLDMSIPLVTALAEGPYVSVVQFHSTIGPLHLRYRERVHGRTIEYEPKGVPLPSRCPRGGFRFAAVFTFLGNSHTRATTTVPCPREHGQR